MQISPLYISRSRGLICLIILHKAPSDTTSFSVSHNHQRLSKWFIACVFIEFRHMLIKTYHIFNLLNQHVITPFWYWVLIGAGCRNALHSDRGMLWRRLGAFVEGESLFVRGRGGTHHSCSPQGSGRMPSTWNLLWRHQACKLPAQVALPFSSWPPHAARY